jgi:hypothetical protein
MGRYKDELRSIRGPDFNIVDSPIVFVIGIIIVPVELMAAIAAGLSRAQPALSRVEGSREWTSCARLGIGRDVVGVDGPKPAPGPKRLAEDYLQTCGELVESIRH